MSNSIIGFWKRPSASDETVEDFLWFGENNRIVHRINYAHGPFVMTLWSEWVEADSYHVQLRPKSEKHRVKISSTGDLLTLEHLDLKYGKSDFQRISKDQVPKLFEKDLAWAQKTMDKLEQKA